MPRLAKSKSIIEDDLPDVRVTPKRRGRKPGSKNRTKQKVHNLPDADVLAARRKDEAELEAKIKKILEADRMRDTEESTSSAELRKDELHQEFESQLQKFSENNFSITLSNRSPGIRFDNVDLSFLSTHIDEHKINYLKKLFNMLDVLYKEDFQPRLNILLEEITDNILGPESVLYYEDIICHLVLICSVLLENRCRCTTTSVNQLDILWKICGKVPPVLQSQQLVEKISLILLKLFKDIHDRIYLAVCFQKVKCDPKEMDSNPLYFSNRIAKYILHYSLYELLDFKGPVSPETLNTYKALYKAVLKGKKLESFEMRERYLLMKLMNTLRGMIPTPDNKHEIKAKERFHDLFKLFKIRARCDTDVDVMIVKDYFDYINLLWIKPKNITGSLSKND